MNYTQGEWFAKEYSMGQWGIHGESGRDIAVIYDHDEHTEANARLIAKAPEMAAVLGEVAEVLEISEVHHAMHTQCGLETLRKVRRILAEIEGTL